jgi:hypothetical protein
MKRTIIDQDGTVLTPTTEPHHIFYTKDFPSETEAKNFCQKFSESHPEDLIVLLRNH